MALQAVGSAASFATSFNAGHLTVDGNLVGEVNNITVSLSSNVVKTYSLNKRTASKIRRGNEEHSISFEIDNGFYEFLMKSYYGSSSAITDGEEISAAAGQPAQVPVHITVYEDEDTTKWMQYQLVDPVISSAEFSSEQEGFGKYSVEMECTEIKLIVADAVSQ